MAVPYFISRRSRKSPGAKKSHLNHSHASEIVTAPSPFMSETMFHRACHAKSAALRSCSIIGFAAISFQSHTQKTRMAEAQSIFVHVPPAIDGVFLLSSMPFTYPIEYIRRNRPLSNLKI